MTDRMREEFEKEYPLPNGASLCGSHYLAPFPADGMSDYNARWESWRKAWQAARTVPDEKIMTFIKEVSEQKPEKSDYWSSCSQCQSNQSEAEDIILSLSAAPEGK